MSVATKANHELIEAARCCMHVFQAIEATVCFASPCPYISSCACSARAASSRSDQTPEEPKMSRQLVVRWSASCVTISGTRAWMSHAKPLVPPVVGASS